MLKKFVSFLLGLTLLNQSVLADSMLGFAQIIKENSEAVIAISVSPHKTLQVIPGIDSLPISSKDKQNSSSLGSGFIISEDGYILTSYHVVEGSEQVMIKFKDSQILEATLIGADKVTDVALLKVNTVGLQKVKIGSVSTLEVGDPVVAIGAPFGFEQSATQGIVSAKNRIVSKEVYVPFIQTDVAINKGNSGGPLFNAQGQVIGINAWIYSQTGGYEGLSFAIPIDLAMNVVTQLKNQGKVSRAWLGVKSINVPLKLAQSFAMSKAYGALIEKIYISSPAQQAGLIVGDIIVSLDGKNIENAAELPSKISMIPIGQRVTIGIIRQGDTKLIEAIVALAPEN